MRGQLGVAAGLALAAAVFLGGSTAASAQPGATMKTVVTGLDNPRGLAFGPDGRLYVAEAGHGGPSCSPDGSTCVGLTSAIARLNIAAGTSRRVVTGLVSVAGSDGTGATGVDGISFQGGSVYGIETGASALVPPSGFPAWLIRAAKNQLGRLIRADTGTGRWSSVANVGMRDWVWSGNHKNLVPGQFPDANPYGVLALPGTQWVVDAGSNTLDRVQNGVVKVVRFFPNPPSSDAVPTCVAKGRDGALYVGELTGGGNAPGSSVVWRFAPSTGKLTKWATGLTAVTGCGFGRNGLFYATELSTLGLDHAAPGTGQVVQVPAHSSSPVTVVSGLNFPGGFAAGPGGTLYVSDWSVLPGHGPAGAPTGSVVQITLG